MQPFEVAPSTNPSNCRRCFIFTVATACTNATNAVDQLAQFLRTELTGRGCMLAANPMWRPRLRGMLRMFEQVMQSTAMDDVHSAAALRAQRATARTALRHRVEAWLQLCSLDSHLTVFSGVTYMWASHISSSTTSIGVTSDGDQSTRDVLSDKVHDGLKEESGGIWRDRGRASTLAPESPLALLILFADITATVDLLILDDAGVARPRDMNKHTSERARSAQLRVLMGLCRTPSRRLLRVLPQTSETDAVLWLEREALYLACARAQISSADAEFLALHSLIVQDNSELGVITPQSSVALGELVKVAGAAARKTARLLHDAAAWNEACVQGTKAGTYARAAAQHPSLITMEVLPDDAWLPIWAPLFCPIATTVGVACLAHGHGHAQGP